MAVIQESYVHGVSTRSADDLVKAMGAGGMSKSQVSRLCAEIDERVNAFLSRPLEGCWPYQERQARLCVPSASSCGSLLRRIPADIHIVRLRELGKVSIR